MCPDWESKQRPFGSQVGAQSTEPHQLGLFFVFFLILPRGYVFIDFRERGMEKERKRNIDVREKPRLVASRCPVVQGTVLQWTEPPVQGSFNLTFSGQLVSTALDQNPMERHTLPYPFCPSQGASEQQQLS